MFYKIFVCAFVYLFINVFVWIYIALYVFLSMYLCENDFLIIFYELISIYLIRKFLFGKEACANDWTKDISRIELKSFDLSLILSKYLNRQ